MRVDELPLKSSCGLPPSGVRLAEIAAIAPSGVTRPPTPGPTTLRPLPSRLTRSISVSWDPAGSDSYTTNDESDAQLGRSGTALPTMTAWPLAISTSENVWLEESATARVLASGESA